LTPATDLGQLLGIVSDSTQPRASTSPFDERSALAELELLADKIQISRRQREKAVAEFDAFVKTFRYDKYTTSIAATDRELRRAEDRPAVTSAATHAARAVPPVVAAPVPAAAAVEVLPPPDSAPWTTATEREPVALVPSGTPRVRAAHIGLGLATLAVLAVVVLLWRSSSGPVGPATPSNPSVAPASGTSTPPAQNAPAPAAAAPLSRPAAPAGPPRALNVEFITVRPVWARITIDGRRAMEREFPADQRIPLGADRTIVIRAGDAGAIRLVVDGKDLGPLGRDGQIFSRAFTAPGQ
jgi:hypothetical protein